MHFEKDAKYKFKPFSNAEAILSSQITHTFALSLSTVRKKIVSKNLSAKPVMVPQIDVDDAELEAPGLQYSTPLKLQKICGIRTCIKLQGVHTISWRSYLHPLLLL